MKFILKFNIFFLLCLSTLAFAELPPQIKNDFAPVSGVIIMPIGEEYLVDLDASVNLREGDILTLTAAGEKVVHPVTKEVLGTLDVVRGYLQVTQVKSGYSYAKILTTMAPPQKGDQIKRFEQVPVLFTAADDGTQLEKELKAGLPHLNWITKNSTEIPLLTFALNGSNLVVKNTEGILLKTYQYADDQLSAPLSTTYQQDNFRIGAKPNEEKTLLNQTVGTLLGTVGIGKKDKRLENPGIIRSQQKNAGIWMGANLDGNPVGLTVGDFDGDGMQETAVAMEDHLQIHRISDGQLKQVAQIDFPGGIHLLSLDTIDNNRDGSPELYLSANVGTKLSSQVVAFVDGQYQRVQNQIPWFFRVVDLPDEGSVLLGQRMAGAEKPFSDTPFRITFSGRKISRGADVPFAHQMNIFSFTPLGGTNNDLVYAHISTTDYLSVSTPQGTTLWEAGDRFGGTETFFYNDDTANKELVQPVYIQQRLVRMPSGEILVPQNDGIRTFQRFRNFTKSRVVAMKWDGFALTETWRTSEQGGYLADFALADADNDGQDELVMAVKYSQKNLIQKGRSTVVIYELNN